MENNLFKLVDEKGNLVSSAMKKANSFDSRLMGLMFKKEMDGYDALLIDPCNSIHTFFMLMSIDVVFLDKENKIVKVIYNMSPWKLTRIYFKAKKVLEMKAGTLRRDLQVGESLREYV